MPPSISIKFPDDYSLNDIGLTSFYDKISEYFGKENKEKKKKLWKEVTIESYIQSLEEDAPNIQDEHYEIEDIIAKDILGEKYMAGNLLKMMPLYNRILFVVGMAHWKEIILIK